MEPPRGIPYGDTPSGGIDPNSRKARRGARDSGKKRDEAKSKSRKTGEKIKEQVDDIKGRVPSDEDIAEETRKKWRGRARRQPWQKKGGNAPARHRFWHIIRGKPVTGQGNMPPTVRRAPAPNPGNRLNPVAPGQARAAQQYIPGGNFNPPPQASKTAPVTTPLTSAQRKTIVDNRKAAAKAIGEATKPKPSNPPGLPKPTRTGPNSRIKAVQAIANAKPNPETGQDQWAPDPELVLVLGAGLVIFSWFGMAGSQAGLITDLVGKFTMAPEQYQMLHNTGASAGVSAAGVLGNAANQTGNVFTTGVDKTWRLFGEVCFIFILYILANISDELSRIVVMFLLGLYLLLFVFRGPDIINAITSVPQGATQGAILNAKKVSK